MCKLCEFSVQKVTPPPKLIIDREFIRHRCLFWASKTIWTLSIFFELEQSKFFTGHQNWKSNGIISSKLFLYHLAAFSISWFPYSHWKEYYFQGVQSSCVRVIKHRVRKSEMFWERHVIECQVIMTEQIAQLDNWPCLMHRNIIPLTTHLDLSLKECALATIWAWETHLSDQEKIDT
jgi:hypothetical protein